MGLPEILHWLVESVSDAHYVWDRARPVAEDVHAAIEELRGPAPAAAAAAPGPVESAFLGQPPA